MTEDSLKSEVFIFWAEIAWANEGLQELITFEYLGNLKIHTIPLFFQRQYNELQSSKSIHELDENSAKVIKNEANNRYLKNKKLNIKVQKLTNMKDQLLSLSITNIFFSQVIDTNNSSIIWEKLLRIGLFSRIADAEYVSSLEDVNFYDTFRHFLITKSLISEISKIIESLMCTDFDCSELNNTKTIVSKW
ncbi:hypothetical protein RIR_jg32856.t1 [Rhizophagus irregularis DAOM 181602=DAOM 197198]|nr:hypothetical protein RhiirB3_454801 [Rhizophagus irregularis]GET50289.1 hypothetical protein RIR_jg32856.t1 [Rhizophagus irregularis DAOM 181602=DAOM 197198]